MSVSPTGTPGGTHPNGHTLEWSMEIDPMRSIVTCYASITGSSTRIRFQRDDLDALIARLVAMKELADKTAELLGSFVKPPVRK